MKPVKTQDSNARLILPEEEHLPEEERRGDLPIEKMLFVGEDGVQRVGFESTWLLEDGERKALANGAPLVIKLWGQNHPPLKPEVGEPDEESMEALVTVEETAHAASKFFEVLADRMKIAEEGGDPIEADEIPPLFQECLKEVVQGGRHRPGHRSRNGSGPEGAKE